MSNNTSYSDYFFKKNRYIHFFILNILSFLSRFNIIDSASFDAKMTHLIRNAAICDNLLFVNKFIYIFKKNNKIDRIELFALRQAAFFESELIVKYFVNHYDLLELDRNRIVYKEDSGNIHRYLLNLSIHEGLYSLYLNLNHSLFEEEDYNFDNPRLVINAFLSKKYEEMNILLKNEKIKSITKEKDPVNYSLIIMHNTKNKLNNFY
jgi:hypothetical protein